VAEKDRLIDGRLVAPGDVLIGLASSGPHANGYSLIRKILALTGTPLSAPFADGTLGERLLTPTRIYVRSLLGLLAAVPVHALAHITGGGLPDNVPRVLPRDVVAVIDTSSWRRPPIFDWLQTQGQVPDDDMWRTFNNGVGMVVCVSPTDEQKALAVLREAGETAWVMGAIAAGRGQPRVELRP
jgi:phosphoribosylformylglycinamidine cyclo-ligase